MKLSLLLLTAMPLWCASPEERIRALLDASRVAQTAFVGVKAVDLETGATLIEHNAQRYFVPASNTKLYSTALALSRLGPDRRFHTAVYAPAKPDAAGVIRGGIVLAGGGDPNLGGRVVPYDVDAKWGDPLKPIDELAERLAAAGIRRIDGSVTGDDTRYVWEPYPAGWGIDDPVWEYGAPVSALTVNDNAFTLRVRPAAVGELAVVELPPRFDVFSIDNRVRTTPGGERRVWIDREPGSRQLRLWGRIPVNSRADESLIGIDDPARFAASALRDALERRGVVVTGGVESRHLLPNEIEDLESGPAPPRALPPVELARLTSAPLAECLKVVNKVSQNLHAELALRAVAKERRGIGSREAGLAELKLFLEEAGVPKTAYTLHDGSGLSRLNMTTPANTVALLRHMYASPLREQWIGLLPVGGADGTLKLRFRAAAMANVVRAKTGTLSHVSTLSGYVRRRGTGGLAAFSVMVNNYNAPSAEARALIDKIVESLSE